MSFNELVADVLTNYAVAWQGSDGAECFGIAMELFNLIEQHVAEEVARETERCAMSGLTSVSRSSPMSAQERTFAALQAMTEGILTRGDPKYMRRRLDECVAIMAERGWQTPVKLPSVLPLRVEFACDLDLLDHELGEGAIRARAEKDVP